MDKEIKLYERAMREYEKNAPQGDEIIKAADTDRERALRFAESVFAGKAYAGAKGIGAPVPAVDVDGDGRYRFDTEELTVEMTSPAKSSRRMPRLPEDTRDEDHEAQDGPEL